MRQETNCMTNRPLKGMWLWIGNSSCSLIVFLSNNFGPMKLTLTIRMYQLKYILFWKVESVFPCRWTISLINIQMEKWILDAIMFNAMTHVGARSSNNEYTFGTELMIMDFMFFIRWYFSMLPVPSMFFLVPMAE